MPLIPNLWTFLSAARGAKRLGRTDLPPWYETSSAVESAVFLGAGASFSVFRQRVQEPSQHVKAEIEGLEANHTLKNKDLPAIVAYKVVKVTLKADGEPEDRDRLALLNALQELLALTHKPLLQHPYILDFLGLAWSSGGGPDIRVPVLIVEYAEYGSLRKFISQRNVSPDLKRSLCIQVGLGLEALHECGIVHGDIKPDNVLIVQKNSAMVAKLADFGFATLGNEWPSFLSGTFLWSAPETVFSCVQHPKNADVFSYGLLTWSVALDGKNPYEVLAGLQGSRATPQYVASLKSSGQMLQIAMKWISDFLEQQKSILIRQVNAEQDKQKKMIMILRGFLYPEKVRFYDGPLKTVLSACLQQNPSQRSLQSALGALGAEVERASINVDFSYLAETRMYRDCLKNIQPISWQSLESLELRVQRSLVRAQQAMAMDVPDSQTIKPTSMFALAATRINGIGLPEDHNLALRNMFQSLRVGYKPAKALIYRFHKTFSVDLPSEYDPLVHLEESVQTGSFAAMAELEKLSPDRYREALSYLRKCKAGIGADFFEESQMIAKWLPDSLSIVSDWQEAIVSHHGESVDVNDYGKIRVNQRGDGLIHYAASCGLIQIVSWLLEINADLLNEKNRQSETPLLCACRAGQSLVVKYLLSYSSVDSSIATVDGDTPLHWMINIDEEVLPEIFQGIMERGANVSAICLRPIAYATSGMGMRLAYGEGYCEGSPLHWAVCRNNLWLVRHLLQHGAHPLTSKFPPSQQIKGRDMYPLYLAAYLHYPHCVRLLLEDTKAKQVGFLLSKCLSQVIGGADLFSCIVRHGVSHSTYMRDTLDYIIHEAHNTRFLTGISGQGTTLLFESIDNRRETLAHLLLDYPRWRAEINVHCGTLESTPLLAASYHNLESLAFRLLALDADMHARGKRLSALGSRDWNALHYFVAAGHMPEGRLFSALLRLNRKTLTIDSNVETPFTVAVDHGDEAMIKRLGEDDPADINRTCSTGCQGNLIFDYPTTPLGRIIKSNLQNSVPRLHCFFSIYSRVPEKPNFIVTPSLDLSALHEAARLHLGVRDFLGTPLMLQDVDSLSNREILLTLLQEYRSPAQLNMQSMKTMETALHMAVDSYNDMAIEEFLAAGADPGIKNALNMTVEEKIRHKLFELDRESENSSEESARLRAMLTILSDI